MGMRRLGNFNINKVTILSQIVFLVVNWNYKRPFPVSHSSGSALMCPDPIPDVRDSQLQLVSCWPSPQLVLITLLCCSGQHWSWNEGACLVLWKGPYLQHWLYRVIFRSWTMQTNHNFSFLIFDGCRNVILMTPLWEPCPSKITPDHQVPLSPSRAHPDLLLTLVRTAAPTQCQSPKVFLREWAHTESPLRSFPWAGSSKSSSSALTWSVSALNQRGAQHHQGHHQSCHPWDPSDPQDHHPGAWERMGAERLAARAALPQCARS